METSKRKIGNTEIVIGAKFLNKKKQVVVITHENGWNDNLDEVRIKAPSGLQFWTKIKNLKEIK